MALHTINLTFSDGTFYLNGKVLDEIVLVEGSTYKLKIDGFRGVVLRDRIPSTSTLVANGNKTYTVPSISSIVYNSKLDFDPKKYVLSKIVSDASLFSYLRDTNPTFALERICVQKESTGDLLLSGIDYTIYPTDDQIHFEDSVSGTLKIYKNAYEFWIPGEPGEFLLSVPQSQTLRSAFIYGLDGDVLPLRFTKAEPTGKIEVARGLPEYIQTSYPLFSTFVLTFYEHLLSRYRPADIIRNLKKYSDLDETFAEFLDDFSKELIPD